jgi:cephalosporin-C deacetylase
MIRVSNKFLTIICCLASLTGVQRVFAQDGDNGGTVSTVLTPHSSDGIFNSTASYTFEVNSTFKKPENGKVSYIVTTEAGKKVRTDSLRVKIESESSDSYNFDISGLKPGFYKVNFMVNVSDYDDTTRKAF